MTYFNPKFFCKQNLKEKDRRELEYWNEVFVNLIDNTLYDYDCALSVEQEIVERFAKALRENLGYEMQENLVGIIDNYEEDVEEQENPDTFLYDDEEDEET